MKIEEVLEKVSSCEDANTKAFIEEAVKAYNAGAFRACINNTWLAIVMNIVYKIDQLALLDDKEANKTKAILDDNIKRNDIAGMLKFEREILDEASIKFELFDPIVLIDLKRIQEDRNRCSHPLLNWDKEPFTPDAELARRHLFIAVDKLLSESNVFGKSVIERIMALINSSVFPVQYKDIKKVLLSSYLGSPKKTLVVNLIHILLKDFIKNSLDYKRINTYAQVLKFFIEEYREWSEDEIPSYMPKAIDFSNSMHLKNLHHILKLDSSIWSALSDENKIFVENYVKDIPSESFDDVEDWMALEYLKNAALQRIAIASRDELKNTRPFAIPEAIRKRAFELYLKSGLFVHANEFSSFICSCIVEANKDELINLINGISSNSQVYESNNLWQVIQEIRNSDKFNSEEFNNLLASNQLYKYVK